MFTRTIEDFICQHCGASVAGNGYTNHCPQCLWSRHVDVDPGDRAASCGGLMEPVAARYERDEYIITHHCQVCGKELTNRASPSDDRDLLISLTTRPL